MLLPSSAVWGTRGGWHCQTVMFNVSIRRVDSSPGSNSAQLSCEAGAPKRGRRWSRRVGRAGVGSMEQVTKRERWSRSVTPECLLQRWGQPPPLPAELAPGSALRGCGGQAGCQLCRRRRGHVCQEPSTALHRPSSHISPRC